ncbi:MAG: hypothetical protein OXG09_09160 [Chloroflexi bacterium]|nr:hypothetical protein [Chloroflexota bacterium]
MRQQKLRQLAELIACITRKGAQGSRDEEMLDWLAAVVFTLRDIAKSVEQTAVAWEKRNHWLKADRFRREWDWVAAIAERLSSSLTAGDVDAAIPALLPLLPKVSGVKVLRSMKPAAEWQGAMKRLREH